MRKERPILICFVGIDGAGKTTQAKNLINALEANGVKSKYVWNTYRPVITKPFIVFAKVLFLRGKDALQNYTEYANVKKGLLRNTLLAKAYEYSVVFDYLCRSLIDIKIPLMLGKSIVSDRYIQDLIINLAVDFNYSDKTIRNMLNVLLRLLPKPDLAFLMDVPEKIGYQRKHDVPCIDYLRQRRKMYLDMAKEYGLVVLDGSKSPTELEHIIKDKVLKYAKRKDTYENMHHFD